MNVIDFIANMSAEKLGKMLFKMDSYLRSHIADEELFYGVWATIGLPDGITEEECICWAEDAINDGDFNPVLDAFFAFAKTLLLDEED